MAIAIGIDFGTCFSAAGFKNGDNMMALKPENERQTFFPSAFYHDRKQTKVGTTAINYGRKQPDFLMEHIKKKLRMSFVQLDDKMYTPKDIVYEILKYLLEGVDYDLRNQFQIPTEELFVVISVPVKFQDGEIRMIREAAERVKLESNRKIKIGGIIQEPVAAALEYLGIMDKTGENIFVYDLGGGTFDIAIMQSTNDVMTPYKVIGQDAKAIGGCDWDADLARILREKVKDVMMKEGIGEEKAESTLNQMEKILLNKAREIKEALTIEESFDDIISYRGEEYEVTVTREEFEEGVADLKKETIQIVKRLRKKCNEYPLSKVIMVGGGSHMPHIKEAVKDEFADCGVEVKVFNPELAIAFGAARYAKLLQEKERPVLLKNPHTYGIGFKDAEGKRYIKNLIFKDQDIPISGETQALMQRYNYFPVFEVECKDGEAIVDADSGHEIMHIHIIREDGGRGEVSNLRLSLSKDCILEFTVIEEDESIKQKVEIDSLVY